MSLAIEALFNYLACIFVPTLNLAIKWTRVLLQLVSEVIWGHADKHGARVADFWANFPRNPGTLVVI